jgi:thioredoxin 1
MSENMIMLNKDNFDQTISVDKLVLVDFWAEWCGPCRMLGPVVEEVAGEADHDKVLFGKVNVDEEEELAKRFGIMSIPTIILFRNGQAVKKSIGFINKNQIMNLIAQNLI